MTGLGPVAVVAAAQDDIERVAFGLSQEHGLRAMDAWHLACAPIVLPRSAESGETRAVATRAFEQATLARVRGCRVHECAIGHLPTYLRRSAIRGLRPTVGWGRFAAV